MVDGTSINVKHPKFPYEANTFCDGGYGKPPLNTRTLFRHAQANRPDMCGSSLRYKPIGESDGLAPVAALRYHAAVLAE